MHGIRTRFLLLVAVFALAYMAFVLVRAAGDAQERVDTVTARQAELALAFDLAIRDYVQESIRPLVQRLVGDEEFVPELMSTSFVARQIFDKVRERFPDYVLKFSSPDPRNPLNRASTEEERVLAHFRSHPEEREWKGPVSLGGKEYWGHFAARRTVADCLRCHGDPADAPYSLVARYGATASFRKSVGELMALDAVAIPRSRAILGEQGLPGHVVAGVAGVLALFAAVFLGFQVVVGRRLAWLSRHFEGVADREGSEIIPIPVTGKDEFTDLARSFNRMASRVRDLHDDLEARVSSRTADLLREVEERRRAERAARESESRYRAVLGGFDGFLVVCDAAGRVEYVNPRCREWLGDDPGGRPCGEVAPLFAVARERLGRGGLAQGQHVEVQDPADGRWYDAVDSEVLHFDGHVSRQTMFVDVSARKEAEEARTRLSEELRQAQKMEAIGQLAGGIAHDFNNILTAIRGNAELLASGEVEGEDRIEFAQDIVTAASRAADLTHQLLTFARKAGAHVVAVDMGRLVHEVADLLRRSIDRRIEVEVNVEAPQPIVAGDPAQLHHALLNLGVNARDAMPAGGRMVYTVRVVDVLPQENPGEPMLVRPGGYVEVRLSDTGPGISEEIRDRIFEPFFTTKEQGKGTGLGLASVYGCLKAHHGAVTVQNNEQGGAEFRLLLPLGVPEVILDEESVPAAQGPAATARILVVDDEASIRRLASRALERLGYEVVTCEDGEAAVSCFRAADPPFALVVLDMTMPRMNGHEAFLAMRESHPGIRAIIASGYMTDEVQRKLEADGIAAVIAKPYHLRDLARVVAEALG